MNENRNYALRLAAVAATPGQTASPARPGFPLPRRHRRLLTAAGTAAAVLLCGLSAGTAVQAQRTGSVGISAVSAAAR